MKRRSARTSRAALARFARAKVLLAFDYDGTLAPIVSDPERAAMRPRTRRLLKRVTELYPCVVISGRSAADLRRRLRGLGIGRAIGNHGIDAARGTSGLRPLVRSWRRALSASLDGRPGVTVEDKGLSIAVHYRRAPRKAEARRAILEAVHALPRARVIGGKDVVNVVPRGAPHKGIALERERARRRCLATVYVGDDETDEDVFSLRTRSPRLGIRVGAGAASAAEYRIRSQARIDHLLETLIGLRGR